jgi:hypothetical protein
LATDARLLLIYAAQRCRPGPAPSLEDEVLSALPRVVPTAGSACTEESLLPLLDTLAPPALDPRLDPLAPPAPSSLNAARLASGSDTV